MSIINMDNFDSLDLNEIEEKITQDNEEELQINNPEKVPENEAFPENIEKQLNEAFCEEIYGTVNKAFLKGLNVLLNIRPRYFKAELQVENIAEDMAKSPYFNLVHKEILPNVTKTIPEPIKYSIAQTCYILKNSTFSIEKSLLEKGLSEKEDDLDKEIMDDSE